MNDGRARAVAFVLLALAACSDAPDEGPALVPLPSTPSTLAVEVGTGFIDYVPLADGDPVDVVFGSQGGWHVWTGVKIADESVQDVRMNLYARFPDGGELAGDPSSVAVSLGPPFDGSRLHTGMRNFIRDGNTVHGKRLVLRVEVVASDGRHGAGERLVVARRWIPLASERISCIRLRSSFPADTASPCSRSTETSCR